MWLFWAGEESGKLRKLFRYTIFIKLYVAIVLMSTQPCATLIEL